MIRTELDDLLCRVSEGDRSAVDPAFRRLWPIVRRYCASKTGNETSADDAAQSTLVKLFEQAAQYDPTKPALAWALAVAYWECRSLSTRDRREAGRTVEASPEHHCDPAPHAEDALSQAEASQLGMRLLADLSPEEQALLKGNEEGLGWSIQVLAPAARRKRKQRIIDRLRSAWDEIIQPGASS